MSFLFRRTSSDKTSDKAEDNAGGSEARRKSPSTTYTVTSSSTSSGGVISGDMESSGARSGSTTYSFSSSSASTGDPGVKSLILSGGKEAFKGQSGSVTYSMSSSSSASAGEPGINSVIISGGQSSSAGSGSVNTDGAATFQMLGEMMASSSAAGETESGVSENGMSAAKTYTITSSSEMVSEPGIQHVRISGSDAKTSEARSGSVSIDGSAASFGALGDMMASGALQVTGSSRHGSMSTSVDGHAGGSHDASLQNGTALINGNGYGSLGIANGGGGRDNERRDSVDSGASELRRDASGRLLGVDMNTLSLGGMSAEDERRLMQSLNARFAKYIDKIRRVEDPETLIKNEVIARVKKIEDEYENAFKKDRARLKDLEIENVHLREVERDLTKKLKDRDKRIVDLEDDLRETQDTLREKIIVIKDLNEKCITDDLVNKDNVERAGLIRQVETVVQHVQSVATFAAPPGGGMFGEPVDETIRPTDQTDVHSMPSLGTTPGPRFGTPLYSKLMALRAETEALCMNTHRNFTTNIGTLQVWAENQATRHLADLRKRNDELSERVGQLQMDLARANEVSGAARNAYEGELAKLRQEMSLHLVEYNALYRAKLTLEAEIATYRKLLEEEEERLGFCFTEEGDENGGDFKIEFGGSGSAQRKSSGMMIQMTSSGYTESSMGSHDDSGFGHGTMNIGGGSGHFESRSEHFQIRSGGQIAAGDDDDNQQEVVASAHVSGDEVRRASGSAEGIMDSVENSLDAWSVDVTKGLDDIEEAFSGDEDDDDDENNKSD